MSGLEVGGFILAFAPVVSLVINKWGDFKTFRLKYKVGSAQFRALEGGLWEFGLLLKSTNDRFGELNQYVPPTESDIRCHKHIEENALSLERSLERFLEKLMQTPLWTPVPLREYRIGKRLDKAQNEIELFRWRLRSADNTINLLVQIFTLRVLSKILAELLGHRTADGDQVLHLRQQL
jgi:hypothetical protein